MALATLVNFPALVELAIGAVSILGGSMAFFSGRAAIRSVRAEESPELLAYGINRGLADGYRVGLPIAAFATILAAWT